LSAEKTLAIVLRVVEFSETSCVVTLYSRDFGKIGALAKGARRPKSPFESALDLLSVCRIVFLHKSSDALDLLTEAKLERRFKAARKDLSRLYAGYYVAELLDALTDADDPHPDLFETADRTLAALDGEAELAPLVLRFELVALRVLGHLPALTQCAGCGKPVSTSGRVAFGQLAGGVLCGDCRVGQRQVVSVSGPVIDALRVFAQTDDAWMEAGLDERVRGELRGVVNHYVANLLGRKPKMHPYLGALGKNLEGTMDN
jgi:DNA repair protein RecO (recombination protein O)